MDDSGDDYNPAFDRAECRKRYEGAFARLLVASPRLAPAELAGRLIELEAILDDGMVEVKTAMLTAGLLSTEDEQALGTWIYRQHHNFVKLGAKAVRRCAADGKADVSKTMRLLALTFLHVGEAVKWELMVGRHEPREYLALHGLFVLAIAKKRHRETAELIVDAMRRWSSIEQLYLRTLLLDRFASGCLTREQIEVLDAWLWEWAKALKVRGRYPGGLVLRVDLEENLGLRYGRREGRGASLYLELAPLEDLRREVIAGLHRGQVFPREGRAAAMPLESHVAVLLQLRTLFAGGGSELAPRAPRHAASPAKVEMHVGLGEIVKALNGGKAQRLFTPRTASATGYLFVVSDKLAAGITVGSLVSFRIDPREGPILGRVVRRVHELGDGWHIGVEAISDPTQPIRVATLESEDGTTKDEFVFVPGTDRSGRFDSFAVTYGILRERGPYHVRADDTDYTLAFNRAHRRGRDWALAGFEILEAAAVAA